MWNHHYLQHTTDNTHKSTRFFVAGGYFPQIPALYIVMMTTSEHYQTPFPREDINSIIKIKQEEFGRDRSSDIRMRIMMNAM
ncbi:hypothetical protein L1887_06423 [Cichorium endivia]|nr:hypothetical protein L1887_06423 [Cichorium endivia]